MQIVNTNKNHAIAVVTEPAVLHDAQAALDVIAEARYNHGAERIALEKAVLSEDFFILSTGLAGEILQKFVNYGVKVAIFGDYSRYTSKPLRDFIRESNRGTTVYFAATQDEAVTWLDA